MRTDFKFSNEFVEGLGNYVGEMKVKGIQMGLTKKEIKKIMLMTFDILGRRSKISARGINIQLSKKSK